MDFSEVCFSVIEPRLLCSPFNAEHIEAHLSEVLPDFLEQLAPKLPLQACCRAGYYEHGSAAVESDLETIESSATEITGTALMSFTEEDPAHFTDGPRRARLRFVFEWDVALLQVWCEPV